MPFVKIVTVFFYMYNLNRKEIYRLFTSNNSSVIVHRIMPYVSNPLYYYIPAGNQGQGHQQDSPQILFKKIKHQRYQAD